jgi:valyl-tRNA synthetase
MDQYGTDALRFALALQAAPGRDIKLSPTRVEGARNFATKLRNATRFCLMNGAKPGFNIQQCRLAVNLWMVDKVEKLAVRLHEALRAYRFHEAAQWVQRESWGSFCDWYVEFCKPIFNGADEQAKDETQKAAFWILSRFLDLLNPFMPFVTEELWAQLCPPLSGPLAQVPLITAQYPPPVALPQQTPDAVATMELLIELISAVRAVFAEFKISPHTRLQAFLKEAPAHKVSVLQENMSVLLPMARLESLALAPVEASVAAAAAGVITLTLGDMVVGLHMAGAIDIAKEKQRLDKEIARLTADRAMMKKKLENTDFMARAPREIVEELQARAGDTEAKLLKNQQTLLSLS